MTHKVKIGTDRITRVDGRPFFPIAARHLPVGADYRVLSEAGFNAVRWTPFGVDRYEDQVLEAPSELFGLKFYAYVYNRGDLSTDRTTRELELSKLVHAVCQHPDLLAYEQRNEPASTHRSPATPQSPAEGLIAGSKVIRELDPHHPICIGHTCGNLKSTLRHYNPAVDAVGCNPYVVMSPHSRQFCGLRSDGRFIDSGDQTLSAVGLYTDKMLQSGDGRAVWMQVQGSANENWYSADYTPENANLGLYGAQRMYPTWWQMRSMAWQAIICGATGLSWMLYGMPVDSHAWEDVTRVVRELRSLHDVLASPKWPSELQVEYDELGFSDWSGVRSLVKNVDGQPWILATNTQFDPMTATFSELPSSIGSAFEVVGEGRHVRVENGRFTDRFQPYEVHIYAPLASA